VGLLFQQRGKTALADNAGLFSSSSDAYAAVQANGFNNASGVTAGSDTNYGVYGSCATATGVYGRSSRGYI
jgi:hypothetical protein